MVCQGTPNSGVPVPPPCPAAGEEGYVSSIGDRVGGAMGAGNGGVKDDMAGVFATDVRDRVDFQVNGKKVAVMKAGKALRKYTKGTRQSRTLGKKPPRHAQVLFDETEKGVQKSKNGKIVLGNLLKHDCESLAKMWRPAITCRISHAVYAVRPRSGAREEWHGSAGAVRMPDSRFVWSG